MLCTVNFIFYYYIIFLIRILKAEKLTNGNSKTYDFLAFDSLNLT